MSVSASVHVVPAALRADSPRTLSPSPLIGEVNPVARVLGAFLLSTPLFATLDPVSAGTALVIELALLWIVGVPPWTVARRTWPVFVAALAGFLTVTLYGHTSGQIYVSFGLMGVSEGSLWLGASTGLRVLAIAVPSLVFVLGMDPTDLADGLVQILRLPQRFVYGALAGIRMFTLLKDDWRALGLSRRSRGLGDGNPIARVFSQGFGLLVLSIRRATKLATAMEARGFGGNVERKSARISRMETRDWLFCAVCLAIPLIALTVTALTGNWHNPLVSLSD